MVALIVIVYLALRMLVNSRIGNVIVATRENPQRAEMLGYDVRKYQLADLCHRQRARGPQRRALHVLGAVHHAVEHRPAGGRHADRVGGVLRTERSDRDAGRLVPAAVRLPDHHGLQPAGSAGADGRAAAGHRDAGAAGLRARHRQACCRSMDAGAGGATRAPLWLIPAACNRMRPDMALVDVKGVTKRFGGLTAVSDVDLTVNAGEIHCLIGPNGAGKSTLFKLIVGLYPPTKGTHPLRLHRYHRRAALCARAARHEHQDAGAERLQGTAGPAKHPDRAAGALFGRRTRRRGRPAADAAQSGVRQRQAGRRAFARPAAMARDRDGAGIEAAAPAAGRADRRHVAGGNLQDRRTRSSRSMPRA